MMMNNKSFVEAEDGPDNSVIYYDEEGNKRLSDFLQNLIWNARFVH